MIVILLGSYVLFSEGMALEYPSKKFSRLSIIALRTLANGCALVVVLAVFSSPTNCISSYSSPNFLKLPTFFAWNYYGISGEIIYPQLNLVIPIPLMQTTPFFKQVLEEGHIRATSRKPP